MRPNTIQTTPPICGFMQREERAMWPFKRKPKRIHIGPQSIDWKPGDMAECIDGSWNRCPEGGPKTGDKLMVLDAMYGNVNDGVSSCFGLRFVGLREYYNVEQFRKITLTDTGADRTVSKSRPRTPAHSGAPQ
jgi:hypothetical protein